MSRENEAIRDRLKTIRKELELSQDLFGKAVGLRRQDVHAIETGSRNPGLSIIMRISMHYNLSANWLLFGIGEKYLN